MRGGRRWPRGDEAHPTALSACGGNSVVDPNNPHPRSDAATDAHSPPANDSATSGGPAQDLSPPVDTASDALADASDDDGSSDAGGDDVVGLDVSPRPDSADSDAGRFPCPRGYPDCDGDPANGCEVALTDDATNIHDVLVTRAGAPLFGLP